MQDRSSQTGSNGRTHFMGLAGLSLSDSLRDQIDALGLVNWVGNIYEAAAEFTQRRHHYSALLVDLRALARPEIDALLTLSQRTGLPVWLLPVDAGRTRNAAALAGGALPWPQINTKPHNGHASLTAHESMPPKAVEHKTPQPISAASSLRVDPISVAPAVPPSVPPPMPPPATRRSPLQGLPARLFEPARAKSENVKPADMPPNEVTSPPPPQYDEISPVLSEEELQALLGPTE